MLVKARVYSVCLKEVKAKLAYKDRKFLDYVSERGSIFVASPGVDPVPSSVLINEFDLLQRYSPNEAELIDGKIFFDKELVADLSTAEAFSTKQVFLERVKEDDLRLVERFLEKNYRCSSYSGFYKEVCEALWGFDLRNEMDLAGSLVGFGVGMTPSGDDFLVGALAALKGTYLFDQLKKAVIQSSSRTNLISREFLLCAAEGEFSKKLMNLIVSLNDSKGAEAYLFDVSSEGHTSGKEGLLGFYKGMKLRLEANL